jgi:hypothetical protein
MKRIATGVLFAFLLTALFAATTHAATVTAASCAQSAVQAALTAAADGDTVAIPAGTCTWTGTISMTLTKSLTVQGAGAISATTGGSSTTGSDQTTILDHHPTPHHNLLRFTISSGKTLRITGLAIKMDGGSTVTQGGVISIGGGANAIRIDHCHFVINADSSFTIATSSNTLTGVIDHNYFDSALGDGPHGIYLQPSDLGDTAWAAPDNWGSDQFLYLEDNRWRNGYLGDSNGGGVRIVFRYNTMANQGSEGYAMGYFANHGITASRARSSRAVEFYRNNVSVPAPGKNGSPIPMNGGTGLIWGNTVTQYRYVVDVNYTRKDNATYNYGSPPTGWGNCNGTTGTVWDGAGGYPCLDQPGRGQGKLLTGYPHSATVNTSTGTQAWPQQAVSPIYVWGNTFTPGGYSGTPVVAAGSSIIRANRDFYQQFGPNGESGTFDGTKGVGQGLLSARPATCTAGPGGNTPGVGYWATDQNTLYVCTATNTWNAYYRPYTYPHPLATGAPAAPAAPTSVQVVQ